MKLREEHETVVGDGQRPADHPPKPLGFEVWLPLREVSARSSLPTDVVIAIDETPVGVFVEIEGGEAHIQDGPPRRWDAAPADYITDSYRTLFLRPPGGSAGRRTTDMVFPDPAERMTAGRLAGPGARGRPRHAASRRSRRSEPRRRCRWPAAR